MAHKFYLYLAILHNFESLCPSLWKGKNMVQIHGLITVSRDQGMPLLPVLYLAPKHFHFDRTKATLLVP